MPEIYQGLAEPVSIAVRKVTTHFERPFQAEKVIAGTNLVPPASPGDWTSMMVRQRPRPVSPGRTETLGHEGKGKDTYKIIPQRPSPKKRSIIWHRASR